MGKTIRAHPEVILRDAQQMNPIPQPDTDDPGQQVIYWASIYREQARLLNPKAYTAREELFRAVDRLAERTKQE